MPFETIAIDFITKLPPSQGYNSILMVTDHDCLKAVIFIPCVKEILGEEVAALYVKHVFACYVATVSCQKSSVIETHDSHLNSCESYASD
jgi:hypothetical protein